MRIFEIILKLAFFLSSMYFVAARPFDATCFTAFLVLSLILGIVLIFNKDSSYDYPQTKKDYFIRRIEGGVLIAFAVIIFIINAQF